MRIVTLTGLVPVMLTVMSTYAVASVGTPGRDTMQRDVEGYAIASCLAGQKQLYLKDQGDGWASVILQRMKGDVSVLAVVAGAIKVELAKGRMAVIRNEVGPLPDKELPILYCSEIIDVPQVREAILKAETKLAPAYRR
jgi:hypothetical protein